MDKLTNKKLDSVLKELAEANAKAWRLRDILSNHCVAVYGVDPSDIDNDQFIYAVDGGCGAANGMTVEEFHKSMLDCMKMKRIKMPGNKGKQNMGVDGGN